MSTQPSNFRPQVLELVQIGTEAAYGTAVPGDKKLLSLTMEASPNIPTEEDMGQGVKGPVGVIIGKEHTEINYSGRLAVNDFAYLASMLLCQPVSALTDGGATRFSYLPSSTDADEFASYTLEGGSSRGAQQIPGLRTDDCEITITPEKAVEIKGKMFGKQWLDGFTMTPNPTVIPKRSISPRAAWVYVSDDLASLGQAATKVKPLQATWGMKTRHEMVTTIDGDETSFEDTVENEKGLTPNGQLVLPMNSAAAGYLDDLRSANVKYVRYAMQGAPISAGVPHQVVITMPFAFSQPKQGKQKSTVVRTFDLVGVFDATLGGHVQVEVDTALTGL